MDRVIGSGEDDPPLTGSFAVRGFVRNSVAVLTEISQRLPQKIIIFIVKKMLTGSKYPKNS